MTRSFIIEVIDENESPIIVTFLDLNGQLTFPTNFPEVKENSATNTVVGTIEAGDPDINEKIVFKLTDDAGGLFTLSTPLQSSCKNVSGTPVETFVEGKLE